MNKKISTCLISVLLLTSIYCTVSTNLIKAYSNIAINYSSYQVSQIYKDGIYFTPDSGYTFAIVNLTITNNGYDSFDTNPIYFSAVADNTAYTYDREGYMINYSFLSINNWSTVSVLNGGSFSGALVFQIPAYTTISSMGYSGLTSTLQSYNIVWNGQASTTTATPTSSPTVPEFSWLAVIPLLAYLLFVAVMLRHRKIAPCLFDVFSP